MVTQSSPTGSQCLPAVGCAEAARYISRRPHLPGCHADGDELTYVSLGGGRHVGGRVLGVAEHRVHAAPARALRGGRQRLSPSRCPPPTRRRRPVAELVRGFRGLQHLPGSTAATTSRSAGRGARGHRPRPGRCRTGPHPRHRHPALLHSAADTQSKYRPAEELADEAAHDPIKLLRERADRRRHPHRGTGRPHPAKRPARSSPRRPRRRWRGRRPDPATVSEHVLGPAPVVPGGGGRRRRHGRGGRLR